MTKPRSARRPGLPSLDAIPSEALARLSTATRGAKGTSDAASALLGAMAELLDARTAWLSLFDPAQNLVIIEVLKGRACPEAVAAAPGQGPIGLAYSTSLAQPFEDGYALPISIGQETPLGVLCFTRLGCDPTPALLAALAERFAESLLQARREDTARRRIRDLETALAGRKSAESAQNAFLASVSEDLKAPLTSLATTLSGLLAGGGIDEPIVQALRNCQRSAGRLQMRIDDLLLLSRLKQGKMRLESHALGLRAAVRGAIETLAPLAAAWTVAIELDATSEVYVRGDGDKLREAVTGSLAGAINEAPRGGLVTLALRARDGLASLTVLGQGAAGPTTLTPSSCLANTLIEEIAALHRGSFQIERSEANTVRTLVLPLFAGAVEDMEDAAAARHAAPAAPVQRPGSILLVEDDHDCREALTQLLEFEGYAVRAVRGEGEAIEAMRAETPALVLLDLGLEDGDGRRTLRRLRANPATARTPVFILSGSVPHATMLGREAGGDIQGFFEKPLNLPRFLLQLRAHVAPTEAEER